MIVKLDPTQLVWHPAAPDLEAVHLEQVPDHSPEAALGRQMLSLPA